MKKKLYFSKKNNIEVVFSFFNCLFLVYSFSGKYLSDIPIQLIELHNFEEISLKYLFIISINY